MEGLLCSFEDSRGWCCAAYTEVAIDYNAGYTGALARLAGYFADQQPFSDCGLDLGWSHPNASVVRPLGLRPVDVCLHDNSVMRHDITSCWCGERGP